MKQPQATALRAGPGGSGAFWRLRGSPIIATLPVATSISTRSITSIRRLQRSGPASEPSRSRSKRPSLPHGTAPGPRPRDGDVEAGRLPMPDGPRAARRSASVGVARGRATSADGLASPRRSGGVGPVRWRRRRRGSSVVRRGRARTSNSGSRWSPRSSSRATDCAARARGAAAAGPRTASGERGPARARGVDAGRDPPDREHDVEGGEQREDARRDHEGEDRREAAAGDVTRAGEPDGEHRYRREEEQAARRRPRSSGRRRAG